MKRNHYKSNSKIQLREIKKKRFYKNNPVNTTGIKKKKVKSSAIRLHIKSKVRRQEIKTSNRLIINVIRKSLQLTAT